MLVHLVFLILAANLAFAQLSASGYDPHYGMQNYYTSQDGYQYSSNYQYPSGYQYPSQRYAGNALTSPDLSYFAIARRSPQEAYLLARAQQTRQGATTSGGGVYDVERQYQYPRNSAMPYYDTYGLNNNPRYGYDAYRGYPQGGMTGYYGAPEEERGMMEGAFQGAVKGALSGAFGL